MSWGLSLTKPPTFPPTILARASQLAERYSSRPSDILGVTADSYLAWCIDEAAAIAANLLEKQQQAESELVLEGPSGKIDLRYADAPFTPRNIDHIKRLSNGQQVINGSFPVKWRD